MKILHLDLETFSTTSIKAGAHRYAEDAEVLLVAWASNDDPVAVWETERVPYWHDALQEMIDNADRVVIHNSAFDRTVLRHVGVDVPVEKITDTMVLALLHGLPGSLGQLCEALGVPQDKAKDKRGKRLINRFTKPQPKNMKVRRATSETHPDEWQEFIEYAALDVDAMRDVLGRLPRWNDTPSERELWRHDQNINDRGIAVDVELAQSALRAFDRAFGTLAARIERLTDGAVKSATQRNATVNYLRRMHFMELADLTKGTVESLLRGDLDPEVRELLEVRQQAAATSPAKYKALIDAVSSDGRLRGTIQFSGAARTGRDCLAEGTLVLVKDPSGLVLEKPIEKVADFDLVWDGDFWVAHGGVVFSGEKDVVEHDGVVATAEHIVYVSTTESIPLGDAKREGLRLWSGNFTVSTN